MLKITPLPLRVTVLAENRVEITGIIYCQSFFKILVIAVTSKLVIVDKLNLEFQLLPRKRRVERIYYFENQKEKQLLLKDFCVKKLLKLPKTVRIY